MASSLRDLTRRHLVMAATAAAGLGALPAGAASLLPTPRQSAGPFYPLELPLDADNDLVEIAGRPERAAGTILHLGGRVLDPDGRSVRGARIEIWQCDALGVYHHSRDRRGPADPNFQGFGATAVTDDGVYRFRTIEPVPYPGRTPHIHFRISGPGFEPLVTQMYIAGHPLNAEDGLYRRLGERAPLVTVRLEPAPDLEPRAKSGAKRAVFDIVLGPDGVPRDS
ncbi:MAG: intradiol ring-cleavage dioxygenase [Geminicoccaceae bacterium]